MPDHQKHFPLKKVEVPIRKAILFDLFGTIVPMFSYSAHERTLVDMALALTVDLKSFRTLWVNSEPDRVRGVFPNTASNVNSVLQCMRHVATQSQIDAAVDCYTSFTLQSLIPLNSSLRLLRTLRSCGYLTGLVSNCAPEVADLWNTTPFVEIFDTTVFSCRVGFPKPSPEIYQSAIDSLYTTANNCVFVGDGSSDELAGAERVGMRSVLVKSCFDDTYDSVRPGVTAWSGMKIEELDELLGLLQSQENHCKA